jgi:hypothetical protein
MRIRDLKPENQIRYLKQDDKWDNSNHVTLVEQIAINHEWSPALNAASLIFNYWKIVLEGSNNNTAVTTQLQNIAIQITNDDLYQNDKKRSPLHQFRTAR